MIEDISQKCESKEDIVGVPIVIINDQLNPDHFEHEDSEDSEEEEKEATSMSLTKKGKLKTAWWLVLLSVVVVAAIICVIVGVTTSKSSENAVNPSKSIPLNATDNETCNYQINISFKYECDNLPPGYEDNFEPALIEYHKYVSIEENQKLDKVSVTLVDYQPGACKSDRRRRRNLGGSSSHRELLRGLRQSNITYNLFAFCFGQCPDQALPFIPISNRRQLQVNNNHLLDWRKLRSDNKTYPDDLPYLTKFKEIFQNIVNLTVTEAKTNITETQKIDCSNNSAACSDESGKCCGYNACRCIRQISTPSIFPTLPLTNIPSGFPTTVPTHFQPVFVQKGGDIDGKSTGDNFGRSVSLSSNGLTVAIGAHLNDGINGTNTGHVRVYEYFDGSWVQKGSDIYGESANDKSGITVALSSDGMITAIGAYRNDGINGANTGHVRVYEYLGGSWVQKGGDIDGESVL